MSITKGILTGISIYLALFFGEKATHFIYFYATHEFGASNLLLIKSSLMLNLSPILGGMDAEYISKKGFISGFLVGVIAGTIVLVTQQLSGANPFTQAFTPSILFDEVFIIACVAAVSGATGELIKLKRNSKQ